MMTKSTLGPVPQRLQRSVREDISSVVDDTDSAYPGNAADTHPAFGSHDCLQLP